MRIVPNPGSRVAVIGGGVSGIVVSHLLQSRYRVTLFEKESRLGGHTNTVEIKSGPDAGIAVDTGFIVLNDRNYPLFSEFLRRLGVEVRWSDMSFSYECRRSGFAYAGTNLDGLFAQRRNLFSPRFYRFLGEIAGFAKEGRNFLADASSDSSLTLGEFLRRGRYSEFMRESYLLPMGAAIWSSPPRDVLDFPVRSFLSFFANHGLLSLRDRPRWQTVLGGSHSYVHAFRRAFRGEIRLGISIRGIRADEHGVTVSVEGDEPQRFDACILCSHADQSLGLLEDPDPLEVTLLGSWRYQRNDVVLHTDCSYLPENRRAWASWNYCSEDDSRSANVTYHMNRLQGLVASEEYCVSLNPRRPVPPERTVACFVYDHPVFDLPALATQQRLCELQGLRGRYYCGSYFGYGFHEDAVRSAVGVSALLGVPL